MSGSIVRAIVATLVLAGLAGCGLPVGPAGEPSFTNVNPITGERGGSGSSSSK